MPAFHARGQSPYSDNPRAEMLAFVPDLAATVLDVGCHTGAFGRGLKQARHCEVWGVEINPYSAEAAAKVLDRVVCGPFETTLALPDAYFDAVVFNDVLEHMVDPWSALHLTQQKLRAGGCVVASIPNLRYICNLRHILLDGDFRYEDEGIRDRTHLRFFTRKSMLALFEDCGYTVRTMTGIQRYRAQSRAKKAISRLLVGSLEDLNFLQYAVVATHASQTADSPDKR